MMISATNIKNTGKEAFKIAIFVGIILSLINQTHHIFTFSFTGKSLFRIFLNFLVPFLVASYSRYTLLLKQYQRKKRPSTSHPLKQPEENSYSSKVVELEKR